MKDEKIGNTFNEMSINLDILTENQERMMILLEAIENDNEELRKQLWLLAQVIKKLKEEIDNLK